LKPKHNIRAKVDTNNRPVKKKKTNIKKQKVEKENLTEVFLLHSGVAEGKKSLGTNDQANIQKPKLTVVTQNISEKGDKPSGISISRELEPESNNKYNTSATVASGEPVPLLFVDVNITPNQAERISIFEGDTAEALALAFVRKHGLPDHKRTKLEALLRI